MARGRDQTQAVTNMINQFMVYHNQGYNIPEIAKKFEVTTTTIYSHLQEIADKNGFYDRKELLERVHPKHNISVVTRQASAVDFDEVLDYAAKLKTKISEVTTNILTIKEEE
ncbi:MAG: helix-turn-helix domain-containing protein [Clostridia bacterium]|nr:helix-turn-helix domain-containing protein [Clostridia bacterium]